MLAAVASLGSQAIHATVNPAFALGLEGERRAALAIMGSNLPAASKDELLSIMEEARWTAVPPGMTRNELLREPACAKTVYRLFERAFGHDGIAPAARGVVGNAWELAANVRSHGGESFPWDAALARPGDMIGFYYAISRYNDDVDHERPGRQPNPVGYSHVALVIAVDPDYGPILIHQFNPPPELRLSGERRPWPLRVETLAGFLSAFEGFFEPIEIIRAAGMAVTATAVSP